MTYGEQLVGLSFNVGNREDVHECKNVLQTQLTNLMTLKMAQVWLATNKINCLMRLSCES